MSTIQDQSQQLPRKTLFITLACLTSSLFVSFFDQTAITTAIPTIGSDLKNARLITSWAGTSYLISNTNFQLLYGRLSDIFGRKQVFLFSLMSLLVGNLVSGFAKNPILLLVFRGISGMGGGGVNCLVMITFSDLLTTRQRGKYFGFVAVSTSLGNGVGPLIGGLLTEKASWRWAFWISCPVAVFCGLLVIFFVPLKPVSVSFTKKIRQIDWIGFFSGMVATILFLVSLSGAGQTWSWKSATFIALFVVSLVAFGVFLYAEARISSLPIIPLRLFASIHRSVLFTMCFLMGWAYFVDIYYFPLYLQNVRGWSPIMSGVIQLPATCSSSIFGVFAGFINSHSGQYAACLWFGGAMWCLGVGLKILFGAKSSVGLLVGASLVQGLGIGFTFQPTLLSLLSHSDSADRSIVTGLRNFFRCFGGAIGLVVSSLIFNSIYRNKLAELFPGRPEFVQMLVHTSSCISQLDSTEKSQVVSAYLRCYQIIMIILTALSGFMFVLSLLSRDGKKDDVPPASPPSSDQSSEKENGVEDVVVAIENIKEPKS